MCWDGPSEGDVSEWLHCEGTDDRAEGQPPEGVIVPASHLELCSVYTTLGFGLFKLLSTLLFVQEI